jgi:hypothetical protein
MMNELSRRRLGVAAYAMAVAHGLLVAAFDVAAPFGDDTEKCTVLLWLLSCGSLGLLRPRRPWRWALLVGPWVPAVHAARHALGLPDSLNPNTYVTVLILLPVSLAVCLAGAYAGSLVGRAGRGP